jgi:hypothetical protein
MLDVKSGKRLHVMEKDPTLKTQISVINIGGKLRSKETDNQDTEVQIVLRILNRMRALGIPKGRRVA